jgi:ubiquinone/menaquinone biosynthesis C-methylase UbiE
MTDLNPAPLISLATSYWNSATLIAAIKLGVFDAISQGSQTPESIAKVIEADEGATDALLIALITLELVERREERYYNTALAQQFLVSDQPTALNKALLYNADVYPLWGQLDEVIRRGDTARDPDTYLGKDEGYTRRFVYGMHHRALGVGRAVSAVINLEGVTRLADIGGGPGTYSALLTQKYPQLSADVLDLPAVVNVAQEIVAGMNASDRVSCRAYDYYQDRLPDESYDAALISGVLHREQPSKVQAMFAEIAALLPVGGRLWISDVMLNDERTGPLFSAMFALNMRALAHHGRCHSVAEQRQWLEEVGFTVISTHQLPPPINYTLICAERVEEERS